MASSRSACSMGERTPCTRVGQAGIRESRRRRQVAQSLSRAAPSARVAASASSSRSSSSAALRSMADAGLFSSWASPAESLPSEIIFSFVQIARSENAGAIEHGVHKDRGHLVALAGHRAKTARAEWPGSTRAPGQPHRPAGLPCESTEERPRSSPARHSRIFCGPAPRSTNIAT